MTHRRFDLEGKMTDIAEQRREKRKEETEYGARCEKRILHLRIVYPARHERLACFLFAGSQFCAVGVHQGPTFTSGGCAAAYTRTGWHLTDDKVRWTRAI